MTDAARLARPAQAARLAAGWLELNAAYLRLLAPALERARKVIALERAKEELR